MNYRRLALIVGVTCLALGLLVSVSPGRIVVSSDGRLVSAIGVVALIQAVRVARRRRNAGLDEAATPDPELPVETPPPGGDFESALEQFHHMRGIFSHRIGIRDGLQSAAVTVLTQFGGYSEAEAEAQVEAGTWTDDVYAAAFLSDLAGPTPSVPVRLRNVLRRGSTFQRRIRRTVDAIANAAGVPPRTPEDPPQFSTGSDAEVEIDDSTGTTVVRETHPTGHWRGVTVVALVAIGIGILGTDPVVLLTGIVGIGFAAYARSSILPPGGVAIDRSLGVEQPEPGDDVEITVTVTNDSPRVLADLRLVDGVPEALAVADGSPRLGTALRPGERTTFRYSVRARRGVHTFGPTLLVARDLAGATEEERFVSDETTLTCTPSIQSFGERVPLRDRATQFAGRVETAGGGEGIEFHATREYRPGDALSRIDWNRRARTGELTTIEFREERAATVVIVIDARAPAYLSPDGLPPHTVDRAVDVAGQVYATLSESGNRVGIASVSPNPCWLAPGSGEVHAVEVRDLLATHAALAPVPPDDRTWLVSWRNRLRSRLSPGTQVVLLTPLCDVYGGRFARHLDEYDYPVTVISPDPTADRTPGHRLARVARAVRISALRREEIPVVDVHWEDTVEVALARYTERWGQ